MVLAVENLTLEFEGLRALSNVGFGVDAGTLTALVGPNGAGKTSLLNCVSGFYAPTRGRVTFEGRHLSGQPPHRVAAYGVARVFQFVELFRHMTVLDNVLLGRHRHMRAGVLAGSLFWGRSRREEARERRRVEEVIEFLELERYRKEPIANLPFGVQKLVGVGSVRAGHRGVGGTTRTGRSPWCTAWSVVEPSRSWARGRWPSKAFRPAGLFADRGCARSAVRGE